MSLEPSVRSRFGGSKVRSGCLTCKARHVKCDEKKPHCERCSRAGRDCKGYADPNLKRRACPGDLIFINYVAPSKPPSLLPTADGQEQRSLDYFQSRTVPELACSFHSELWSRFMLQTAQHEPAIRHGLTALASLHEYFENAEHGHAATSKFGFQQYMKAIQCVVKGTALGASQSSDVALISCILFTALESLQGHYRSALTHINSGLKVLAEREASGHRQQASYIPTDLLQSLFTRFDTQALEIGDIAFRPWLTAEPETKVKIPSTFSTLEEAERVFDKYYNNLMHFLQSAEVTDIQGVPVSRPGLRALQIRHSNRIREYDDWCAAFDKYLAGHLTDRNSPASILRSPPHPGILILQIWRILVRVMLHIDLSVGEVVFDTFIEEMRSITDLAESFVKQTAAPPRTTTRSGRIGLTSVEHDSSPTPAAQRAQLNTHPRPWLGSCASHGFLGIKPESTPCVPADRAALVAKSTARAHTGSYLGTPSPNYSDTCTTGSTSTAAPTLVAPKPLTSLKPTFSLSMGLISPLYITATHCRDPIIRRRALHLLHTCNRREGIWDSRLAAQVARRVLQVEEANALPLLGHGHGGGGDTVVVTAAEQIPEHARVREMEVSFISDCKGIIRFTKSVDGGISRPNPAEYYEEILEW